MTRKQAENVLIQNARRGYPADANDLRDMYGEESYEMRANGMRPPSFDRWVKDRAATMLYSIKREAEQNERLATPRGQQLEAAYEKARKENLEAMEAEAVFRTKFEALVRERTGKNLYDLPKETRQEDMQKMFPNEMAKLKELYEEAAKSGVARQKAADERNEYLNSGGRAARSEKDFFPVTILPNGDFGMDLNNMTNKQLKSAYEQFKTPDPLGDSERRSSDRREFLRIADEMDRRGL